MAKQKKPIRYGRGGTSQYHHLVNRDRICTRTYRLNKQLADDITQLANKYKISSNDLAHWLLEEAVDLIKSGKIEPKVEAVINHCVR